MLAAPLTKLLAKNTPLTWVNDQETAFSALKDALSALPQLTIPCPTKAYDVYVDASDFALGAVLEQEGKPVAFASRTLTTHERRYSTYDKELTALFYGLKQFQCYLWGADKIILRTDHSSLQHLMKQKDLSGRQARYLDFFSQFRFEIRHVKGPSNRADALSRVDLVNLVVSQLNLDTIKTRIHDASSEDPLYVQLRQQAKLSESPYELKDDWYIGRLGKTPLRS